MINYNEIEDAALRDVAEFMAVAAGTAPKTRGRDNLKIIIVENEDEKRDLMVKMKEIAARDKRPSCERDADNIKDVKYILIIGTKAKPLGLDCGFCGYQNCKALVKEKGICAYNSIDLGIALGSAASLAARFHVDKKLMYSKGKAANENNLFKEEMKQAIGIPLSATGKNPFFDRR